MINTKACVVLCWHNPVWPQKKERNARHVLRYLWMIELELVVRIVQRHLESVAGVLLTMLVTIDRTRRFALGACSLVPFLLVAMTKADVLGLWRLLSHTGALPPFEVF